MFCLDPDLFLDLINFRINSLNKGFSLLNLPVNENKFIHGSLPGFLGLFKKHIGIAYLLLNLLLCFLQAFFFILSEGKIRAADKEYEGKLKNLEYPVIYPIGLFHTILFFILIYLTCL